MVAVTFLTALVSAAAVGAPGVFIVPLQKEFGWSTAEISSALSIRFILFGLMAPFAAALLNRYGLRNVTLSALLIVASALIASLGMTKVWQLMLLWGVERRSGPLWIAIAASMKAVPLLLAVVYAGRGEWLRAGLALLLTVLLVAPAFLFDLSGYSTQPGPGNMSLISVTAVLYVIVALGMAGMAFIAARSPYRWVAGALAVMAALPRFLTYEISFLLVGVASARPGPRQRD